jgi:hypothetical protein
MELAVITIGQIGFDPMRVPAPARGAEARSDRFEQALERAARPEESATPAPEPLPAAAHATPGPTTTAEAVPPSAAPAALAAPAEVGTHPASTEAGDPAPRIAPGKGAGSPASSPFFSVPGPAGSAPAVAIDPAMAGAVPSPTAIPAPGIAAAPAPHGANPVATAARTPALPGTTTPAAAVRTAAPALAGYRSLSPATLQLAEAARDSVFRQIALRVDRDGGELRLLLDPPELGELDLRLVVEKGGALRLSIGAERPELLLAIDKHMHELRQALAMHGLDVAHAEVHARERGSERHSGGDAAPWRPLQPEPAAPAQSLRADGEWWTAEGFALWA